MAIWSLMNWTYLLGPMAPVGSGGARSFSSTPLKLGAGHRVVREMAGRVPGCSRAALSAAAAEYRSNAAGPPIGMYPWVRT